jgi:uncharacterized protein involved in exopolysaccharide biosynthesis
LRTARRISSEDLPALLWRRKGLMLLVFLLTTALGVVLALTLKTQYQAHASLLVRLGQEYVYDPRVGDAARGAVPDTGQVIQSETEILQSSVLKEKVLADIGLDKLYPDLAKKSAGAGPEERRKIEGSALKSMETGLKIVTAPDTSVVRVSFNHPDPSLSATVVNTLLDEYLLYRRQVLADRDAGALGGQKRKFEGQLADADAAYRQFLTDNGIGDFETEKASLQASYSQLLTESYAVAAQLSETESSLAVTARQASTTAPEIGLYRDLDHSVADKLQALKIERQDLLSRYQPTAQPVRDKDAQIAALEQIQAQGSNAGGRRVGVNPVYQTLQTEKAQLESRAASLRSRKSAIAAELADITTKRQRLTALEPRYQDLARARDLLSANVKTYQSREQDAQARQALDQQGSDAVRIIERAFVPTRGTSLKVPVVLVFAALGLFLAACAGLLSALFARGYPSTAAVERTLVLPVLGSAPRKAPA